MRDNPETNFPEKGIPENQIPEIGIQPFGAVKYSTPELLKLMSRFVTAKIQKYTGTHARIGNAPAHA